MKMKTFLVAALATMTLAACSKDADTGTPGNTAKTNFEVALPGALTTYAIEDPQAAGKITPFYNDVTVYLVDAGGNAVGYEWLDEEIAAKKKSFEQIAEPSKVIVIVNKYNATLPDNTTTSGLATALGALTVANQNVAAKTTTSADAKGNAAGDYLSLQQVTLYGEAESGDFTPGTAHEGHTVKNATVELSSLVSRFEVGTVQAGTGLKSLTVKNVYINYFVNDYGRSTNQSFTESTWPATFTPAWATDAYDSEVTSVAGTKAYAYQVFAGALVPHIIYQVDGTVEAGYKLADGTGDADVDVNFTDKFITVKGFQIAGTSITKIEPHKIYKMGLSGGGTVIKPGEITDKPEKNKIDLLVAIEVAEWTVQDVTAEI